jgi:hypothetical protein
MIKTTEIPFNDFTEEIIKDSSELIVEDIIREYNECEDYQRFAQEVIRILEDYFKVEYI